MLYYEKGDYTIGIANIKGGKGDGEASIHSSNIQISAHQEIAKFNMDHHHLSHVTHT